MREMNAKQPGKATLTSAREATDPTHTGVVQQVLNFAGPKSMLAKGRKKRMWQDNMTRTKTPQLMNHSLDLVVALRDVAGLSWGGTEMSEGVNGGFMHFDCRHEGAGAAAYAFALKNKALTDDKAKAELAKDAEQPKKAP